MKKITFFSGLLLLAAHTHAQNAPQDTTLEAVPLREAVISVTRQPSARLAAAQQVKVLRRTEIEFANAQSTADLLSGTGQVFVQKSQQGGGSPGLRGFEASRVLLVVDGIRMNNAIYRAGHLQNVITMDNAALERAEVLYGPASTVYGSDALGGAICFFTKNPVFAREGERSRIGGSGFFRYGSVNQEKTAHAELNLGGSRIASITSFTYSDFGDLLMGKEKGSGDFFGKRDYYVERINGKDSLVANADPYLQKFSGFKQYDLLEKISFLQNERVKHTLNIQYSNSSDIPRYDRLTDPAAGGLASAEWYYGPQKRLMAAYHLNAGLDGFFDGFNLTAAWQDIEESRHNRNFGATNRTDRIETVGVYSLLAEVVKSGENHNLHIGLDGQYNDVTSVARRINVNTGDTSAQSTRYPDGGSRMFHAALYVNHQWTLRPNSAWTFSEGLRAGYAGMHAHFEGKDFFPFPFDEVTQNSPVVSGHAGVVWSKGGHWRAGLNGSTGFRVPNVDDLTKVFDSKKGSVVVPNPDLKPEKTLNLDLTLTYMVAGKFRWENVFWVTAFRDAIVTDLFQFNGQDSIKYDGEPSRVLAPQNKRSATITGFSSSLEADVTGSLALYGGITFTKGTIASTESTESKPLDHIPPLFGKAGLRWHQKRYSAETFVLFNGKKKLEDYNLEGEDNLQYAPADGMPSWFTWNLRAAYNLNKHFSLQAGIDNLLDTQYRMFASGINGPGRNFWVTGRVRF